MNADQKQLANLLKRAYDVLCELSDQVSYTLLDEIEEALELNNEGTRDETPEDWRDSKHDRGNKC